MVAGAWLLTPLLLFSIPGATAKRPTDHEAELRKIQQELSPQEGHAFAEPIESVPALKYVSLLYRRASLTGDFADLKAAETAIDEGLQQLGSWPDLCLLKAQLELKLHRLEGAKRALARVQGLGATPEGTLVKADIALQEGRYEEARRAYQAVIRQGRTWDRLARLAYLRSKTGDIPGADRLYAEAQDELSAKEMRAYAWVELQRGLLDLEQGRYPEALAHYEHANKAYSGYWLIEEHLAEVLGLLGRVDEAAALYRSVIARTRNPEFVTALAGLLESQDRAVAEALYADAEQLFRAQYSLFPEAALGHFIQHLIEREEPGLELIELARKNHHLRPNAESKLLLAKAYLRLNEPAKARALVQEVLWTPWRTPELSRLALELRVKRQRPGPQRVRAGAQ